MKCIFIFDVHELRGEGTTGEVERGGQILNEDLTCDIFEQNPSQTGWMDNKKHR